MKKHLMPWFALLMSSIAPASASAAAGKPSLEVSSGPAYFTEGRQTYIGIYVVSDQRIAVTVNGLDYKGHYASLADDNAGASSGARAGKWGRAFLFASSASSLQCQLDAGFPNVKGQCQAADGRVYQLGFRPIKGLTPPGSIAVPIKASFEQSLR